MCRHLFSCLNLSPPPSLLPVPSDFATSVRIGVKGIKQKAQAGIILTWLVEIKESRTLLAVFVAGRLGSSVACFSRKCMRSQHGSQVIPGFEAQPER